MRAVVDNAVAGRIVVMSSAATRAGVDNVAVENSRWLRAMADNVAGLWTKVDVVPKERLWLRIVDMAGLPQEERARVVCVDGRRRCRGKVT
jgi:hypothetical protein